MRRYVVPATIATAAVALLGLLASGLFAQGPNDSIAYSVASHRYRAAPGRLLALPTLTGDPQNGSTRTLKLAQLEGRPVLINLFASWCEPCQAEAPVLRQAQAMLRAHGGTVLGVIYQDSPDAALGFVRRFHLDYPVVRDPGGTFADALGVTNNGVPDTYLVDPAGRIVALNLYQLTPQWLHGTLPRLLAGAAA